MSPVFSYFSDKMYTYFDGSRANADINIIGSEIRGASSIDITSNADATLKLTTGNLDSHALLLYGLGSGTESKVTVTGSTISALNETDNVGINAYSTINHSIDYDSSNFKTIVDNNGSTTGNAAGKYSGYNFSLLNNSISSNNNVTINTGVTIEAENVDVNAIGFNKSDIKIQNVSNVGENAERSGISVSMLINHTDTKADVLVQNSTINANGNAHFIAENIESIQNKVETKVQAKQQDYTINTKEMANFSPTYTIKLYDWLNKKFLNKASDKVGSLIDKTHLEFAMDGLLNNYAKAQTGGQYSGIAGSVIVNSITKNTTAKAVIDSNSTINNAQDIKMNANSVYDSNNYAIGASGLGTGANFVANVILNDFISKTGGLKLDANSQKSMKIMISAILLRVLVLVVRHLLL